jgi:hypothetical protein
VVHQGFVAELNNTKTNHLFPSQITIADWQFAVENGYGEVSGPSSEMSSLMGRFFTR